MVGVLDERLSRLRSAARASAQAEWPVRELRPPQLVLDLHGEVVTGRVEGAQVGVRSDCNRSSPGLELSMALVDASRVAVPSSPTLELSCL